MAALGRRPEEVAADIEAFYSRLLPGGQFLPDENVTPAWYLASEVKDILREGA